MSLFLLLLWSIDSENLEVERLLLLLLSIVEKDVESLETSLW